MPKSPRDRCVDAATEMIDAFIAIIVGHHEPTRAATPHEQNGVGAEPAAKNGASEPA